MQAFSTMQDVTLAPSSRNSKTLAAELLPVHGPAVRIIPHSVKMLALGARGELEAAGEQAHLCRGRFTLWDGLGLVVKRLARPELSLRTSPPVGTGTRG